MLNQNTQEKSHDLVVLFNGSKLEHSLMPSALSFLYHTIASKSQIISKTSQNVAPKRN